MIHIVNVLAIENPNEFYNMVCELDNQLNGEEGNFIFLDGDSEISLDKMGWLVRDVFNLDLNDKKLLSLLYKRLERRVYESDTLPQLNEISRAVYSCLDDLFFHFPFALSYDEPLPSDIFKVTGVRFESVFDSLEEKIICYINALVELKNCKLIIFVNLKSVLTDDALTNVYKHCQSEKICLLLIESQTSRTKLTEETVTIITEDLCEILVK